MRATTGMARAEPFESRDRRAPVITRETVEHRVSSVLVKLGLTSRGEAAAYAAAVWSNAWSKTGRAGGRGLTAGPADRPSVR